MPYLVDDTILSLPDFLEDAVVPEPVLLRSYHNIYTTAIYGAGRLEIHPKTDTPIRPQTGQGPTQTN